MEAKKHISLTVISFNPLALVWFRTGSETTDKVHCCCCTTHTPRALAAIQVTQSLVFVFEGWWQNLKSLGLRSRFPSKCSVAFKEVTPDKTSLIEVKLAEDRTFSDWDSVDSLWKQLNSSPTLFFDTFSSCGATLMLQWAQGWSNPPLRVPQDPPSDAA